MIETYRIAAYFEEPQQVEEAIYRIGLLGVPRDLIEVVVSPTVASRYGGRAHRLGNRMMAYAGAGALIGLLLGIALSLVVVLLPGTVEPGWLAFVQLLGPNAATLLGALLGGLLGALVPQRPVEIYHLAHEREEILLVVHRATPSQAERLVELLQELGSDDVRVLKAGATG